MRRARGLILAAGAAAGVVGTLSQPASAHNAKVHQAMTDYAYELMRAAAATGGGNAPGDIQTLFDRLADSNPGMGDFYKAAAGAAAKLRALPSGLPNFPRTCMNPDEIAVFGNSVPDFQVTLQQSMEEKPMGDVVFPLASNFLDTDDCSIDVNWKPSGVLDQTNPGDPADPLRTRDHTGTVIGYWATNPDLLVNDWHLRSTMSAAEIGAIASGAAFGTTVAVSAACLFACGLFPPACIACPILAVGAGGYVADQIAEFPWGDWKDADLFTGFGHFIDVKPLPAGAKVFDDVPGKLSDRAGPHGIPDRTENLVGALFDIGGFHVRHDLSDAPKNYEIVDLGSGVTGKDFHLDTTHRTDQEWESKTVAHTNLTALDNLGQFGLEQFEGHLQMGQFQAPVFFDSTLAAKDLGFPLHALGDATVPQHVTGTSGWGHRPYEEAMEDVLDSVLGSMDLPTSTVFAGTVLVRALAWRNVILSWRNAHPGVGNEVPLRDMVTALAQSTFTKSLANESTLFNEDRSFKFATGATGSATAGYSKDPAMIPLFRDLLADGIAAEMAFLTSQMEVLP